MPAAYTPAGNGRVFDKVWDTVHRRFYDTNFHGVDWSAARNLYRPQAVAATNETQLYLVLREMLNSLQSSHTGVTPPSAVRRIYKDRAVNVGTVALAQADQPALVFDVLPDSPAAEAGVRRGWIIVRDWERTPKKEGPICEGDTLSADFLDENDQLRSVQVVLREISTGYPPTVQALPEGWICLRFDEFNAGASRWLHRQLRRHRQSAGILIDLRLNRGGYRYQLARIARQLFPTNTSLGTFVTRKNGVREFASRPHWASIGYDGPLGILVSKNTASSAEILAGAVQSHRRGTLFSPGPKTAGAVAGSLTWMLPDGGRLSVAIEAYQTPEGHSLEGEGLHPDRKLPPITAADLRSGVDTHVKAALEIMKAP